MSNATLPLSLALDEDQAFEAILADIPLFCVGIMAVGSITFIFAMKHVNLLSLYLCSASLLLFVAAILDLGQLLIREPTGDDDNIDQGVVSGFIVAREVGLGLSYGFLFLFVWRAVAERPWGEQRKSLPQPNQSTAPSQPHSASWARWGHLGSVLKWFTLSLVIVIPLLQIAWRLLTSQRQYGSIYIADSTLEIVTSAIFILKIILNVLVSPSRSWWTPFRSYLGLVLALIITGAMGVGNLVSFAFSETVLGRFLRAISIYILLLWNLISIFNRRSITRQPLHDQEASSASPQLEKPEEQIIKGEEMGPIQPREQTPSIVTLERAMLSRAGGRRGPFPLRISTASRLSVFVNRMEQNETLAEITRTLSNRTLSTRSSRKSPLTPIAPKRHRMPDRDVRFDIITPTLPSTAENPKEEPLTPGLSLSYYTMNPEAPDVPAIRKQSVNQTKPSLYQLHGKGESEHPSLTSLVAQPPSQNPSMSFDELMRQQDELDESIANLRLLSVDSINLQSSESAPAPEGSSITGDTAMSAKSQPQSTLRTESLSPRSEFSFSAFPIPPPGPENTGASRFSKPTSRKFSHPPTDHQEPKPTMPILSVPDSPSQTSMVARMTSGATQYDVTSFIGNLTEPGDQVRASMNGHPGRMSENITPDDREGEQPASDPVASGSVTSHLRPMLLPAVASGRKVVPPSTVRPIRHPLQPSQLGQRDSSTTLKPFFLGTSTTSIPTSLPSSTMVPLSSRKGSRAARVQAHKSQISTPRLNVTDVFDEEAPETYERPRPPPILVGLLDRPKA